MAEGIDRTPLAQLELLVAVRDAGSVSAAARSLGCSQPTVSAGLVRLERHLRLRLVTPSARGTTLTAVGQVIATRAEEVLAASTAFERAAENLRHPAHVVLVIAASMTIAEYLVPRWLATADADLRIELMVRNSEDVMDLVEAGDADLGFVEGPHVRSGLAALDLRHDSLVVVVAPDHPWAAAAAPITAAELMASDLVVREIGSGTRQVLAEALAKVGRDLPSDLSSLGSTAAVRTAVVHSGRVGVLSRIAVADSLHAGILKEVPLADVDLGRTLRAVWRPGTRLSPAASRFLTHVRER